MVLQDYPQATGVHLSVSLLNRVVDELPQIKVLKHEDCPGLGKISRIRASAERDGGGGSRSWSATARSTIRWSWPAAPTAR